MIEQGSLLAGWASVSITPDRPVQLQGQHYERVSESVHDPCTATALALETLAEGRSLEQGIMISCDLTGIPGELTARVRDLAVKQLAGFDPRRIFISATHTHTAPVLKAGVYPEPRAGVMRPAECFDFLCRRLADIAAGAWANRGPAGMSRALGHAAVGFNRRLVYASGEARMYGSSDRPDFVRVEGGSDPGVEILFFHGDGEALKGVVVNVACPSQVIENKLFVSADFWHPARENLRRVFGPDLFVYPMAGAAGDQSPRDLVRRGRGVPSMRELEGMEEMGERISLAVERAWHKNRSEVSRELCFQHRPETFDLPARRVTVEEAGQARRDLEEILRRKPEEADHRDFCLRNRHLRVIERFEKQGEDPRFVAEVNVMRLGDAALATNPFELYLDYGLRIKGRSRAEQTLIAQLANHPGAYLSTRLAMAGGGYGGVVASCLVGPEGGDLLVDRTVEAINVMWD